MLAGDGYLSFHPGSHNLVDCICHVRFELEYWTTLGRILVKVNIFELLEEFLGNVASNTVVIDCDELQVEQLIIDLTDLIDVHKVKSEHSNH